MKFTGWERFIQVNRHCVSSHGMDFKWKKQHVIHVSMCVHGCSVRLIVLSGFEMLNELPVCLALGTMFICRHWRSVLSLSVSLFSAVSLRPIDCAEHPAFNSLKTLGETARPERKGHGKEWQEDGGRKEKSA